MRLWRIVTLTLIALFIYLVTSNAWVVDDAFITFRSIDNFLHGYGLTWNVGERVQVYTHPLWMWVMTLAAYISSDYYFSVLVVSGLCTLGVVAVALRLFWSKSLSGPAWQMPFFLLLLCCSKAFIDYSTSGLENPLSHLFGALFVLWLYKLSEQDDPMSEKDLLVLVLIATLSGFNRLDTVLLYAP